MAVFDRRSCGLLRSCPFWAEEGAWQARRGLKRRGATAAAGSNGRVATGDVTPATDGFTAVTPPTPPRDTAWREFHTVFGPMVIAFPGAAAIASTVVYLMPPFFDDPRSNGVLAVLAGVAFGLVIWVSCAFMLRRLSRADGANPCVHGELARDYLSLRARLDALSATTDTVAVCAVHEARLQLDPVGTDLGIDGPHGASVGSRWTLGSGYTAVWRRLHRAEECLINIEPVEAVVAQALNDELRLQGARMPMRSDLLAKLRQALIAIDPASARYLGQSTRAPESGAGAEPEARMVIRMVRHAISEFRDDRRDGLIRARNNLLGTALYTSLIAYLVLGLAMVAGTSTRIVTAAAAFFLVGATVGLFRHLRLASARDTQMEEDYGLATARLIQRPLFSGLAAVGGVILTALLPRLAPSGTVTPSLTTLDQIFNLTTHPEYLVVAAVFGLTPSLLMAGLQKQAESYKADLKSSEPAESTPH